MLRFPEQAVPFVNEYDKGAVCFCINIFHDLNKVILIAETYMFKLLQQVERKVFLQHCQHFIHAVRHAQKILHVDFDYIVLIQMLAVRCCMADRQAVKQRRRILAAGIVCRQHIHRHRLAKTARTADTNEFLFCIEQGIRLFNQSGLIDINF